MTLALLALSAPTLGGDGADADPWAPFRDLVGTWRGEAASFGSVSDLTHEWDFVVQGRFLRLRTRSVQRAEGGDGEVHEDVGYLSRDTDHGGFVFRQFLSEGFVNTYDVVRDGSVIRFDHRESESAGGMRARMRLTFGPGVTYDMVLDLAGPEGDFSPCQQMHLARIKAGPD